MGFEQNTNNISKEFWLVMKCGSTTAMIEN
jgi:hypothetical protein